MNKVKKRQGFRYVPISRKNFTKEEYEKIHLMPHTTTKKFLWGLWSHSKTETLIFIPRGVYKLEENK